MLGLPGGLPGILTCGVGWGGVYQRWCSCVHMVRCWCVMCTHGTLLVCHVQTYHAITVSCSIVHRSATRCTKSNSTKQHSWQIVSNGNAVNYRLLLIFPPDLAKKNQVINCIWKHDMKSSCEQPHFIWKNTVKSTPWLQEQQTAADTHDMLSQSTLFQAGQTPPADPICLGLVCGLARSPLSFRVGSKSMALGCCRICFGLGEVILEWFLSFKIRSGLV